VPEEKGTIALHVLSPPIFGTLSVIAGVVACLGTMHHFDAANSAIACDQSGALLHCLPLHFKSLKHVGCPPLSLRLRLLVVSSSLFTRGRVYS
jgi:hypothetical protein